MENEHYKMGYSAGYFQALRDALSAIGSIAVPPVQKTEEEEDNASSES